MITSACLLSFRRQAMQTEQNRTGFGSIAFDFVRMSAILFDLFDKRTRTKWDQMFGYVWLLEAG